MNDKLKITLSIVIGVIGAILLFCLIVIIGCSINGLTFGEQVCKWFSPKSPTTNACKQIASMGFNIT